MIECTKKIKNMKINPSTPTTATRQSKQTQARSDLPQSDNAGTKLANSLLKGVVVAETSGEYLIKTDSGVLSAKSFYPLEIGQELWFSQLGDSESSLIPASPQKAMPAIMRLLLPLLSSGGGENPFLSLDGKDSGIIPESTASASETHNLQTALKALYDYGAAAKPDPLKFLADLAAVNKSGGGSVELGRLLDIIDNAGDKIPKNIAGTVSHLKNLLEAHSQFNNQVQIGQPDLNLVLFPLYFAGATGWGEWLFSFDQQGDEDTQGGGEYGISFYLTMSRLGEMHLQLSSRDKELRGRFTLASQEAVDHVQANLPQLLPVLEKLYKPVNLSCQCQPINNLKKIKDDMTAKVGSSEFFTLVDLTA